MVLKKRRDQIGAGHRFFCRSMSDILRLRRTCHLFSSFLEFRLGSSFLLQFLLDVRDFRSRKDVSTSRSLDSFDSGIVSSPSSEPATDAKSLLAFALGIYQSYVAPDAPMELKILPHEMVSNLIQGVCTESGTNVSIGCFDEAASFVKNHLEVNYLPEFLCGEFFARYQLELLPTVDSKTNFSTRDILSDDQLTFCFMEFVESEGRALLEFCINVCSVRESLLRTDASVIYDKFVPVHAPSSLGFDPDIRFKLEEKIRSAGRNVDADCFDEALGVAIDFLDDVHLAAFVSSNHFKNHISELEKLTSRPLRRHGSSSSVNASASGEIQNTLLASASPSRKSSKAASNFLDLFNADPGRLYRRKYDKVTNIGHVDHLGRYVSCVSVPFHGYRIGQKLKRLVISESEERSREQLRWQAAEKIVNEVLLNIHSGHP